MESKSTTFLFLCCSLILQVLSVSPSNKLGATFISLTFQRHLFVASDKNICKRCSNYSATAFRVSPIPRLLIHMPFHPKYIFSYFVHIPWNLHNWKFFLTVGLSLHRLSFNHCRLIRIRITLLNVYHRFYYK